LNYFSDIDGSDVGTWKWVKPPTPVNSSIGCRYVDYVLLMSYNYHGNWNKYTGHHSAMFPRSDEVAGEREWNQVLS